MKKYMEITFRLSIVVMLITIIIYQVKINKKLDLIQKIAFASSKSASGAELNTEEIKEELGL